MRREAWRSSWIFFAVGAFNGLAYPSTRGDEWAFAQTSSQGVGVLTIKGNLIAKSEFELLIQTSDQRLWRMSRADLRRHAVTPEPTSPLGREPLSELLRAAFPDHKIEHSTHYLVCHDVSPDEAHQAERLLERVYQAYFDFCRELELPVHEPDFLLVVLLFRDGNSFSKHMLDELGGNAANVTAFYSLASNQIACHLAAEQARTSFLASSVPLDARTKLATHLVHEATHQLMCNSGLQQRMAEYPLWVSEGLAAYFEPGDPYAPSGWRRPGTMNTLRLGELTALLHTPGRADLTSMISSDASFRNTTIASESYSLAWGLTYFLLKRHPREFAEYLCDLSHAAPLVPFSSDQRLEDFSTIIRLNPIALPKQLADFFD